MEGLTKARNSPIRFLPFLKIFIFTLFYFTINWCTMKDYFSKKPMLETRVYEGV